MPHIVVYGMLKMHYVDFHQKRKDFIDFVFFYIPKQTK